MSNLTNFNHTPEGQNPFSHYANQLQTELELETDQLAINQSINRTAQRVAFDHERSIQAMNDEVELQAHIRYLETLDKLDKGQRAKFFRGVKAKCEQAEHSVWKD